MNKLRALELDELRAIMQTGGGRRTIYRMMIKCGVNMISYSPDAPKDHIFFREGSRNVGLWIASEAKEASPELYLQMMQENIK